MSPMPRSDRPASSKTLSLDALTALDGLPADGASATKNAGAATRVRWVDTCRSAYFSSEAFMFIATGDVDGFAFQNARQRDYLVLQLERIQYTVIFYDRALGFTFPDPQHRERATRLLREADEAARASGEKPRATQPATAVAAALAGLAQPGANSADADPFEVSSPRAALALIEKLLRCAPDQIAVLVSRADLMIPNADKAQMSPDDRTLLAHLLALATDETLAKRGNMLYLFSRRATDIHADLRAASSGVKLVDIELPDRDARLAYLRWYLAEREANEDAIRLNDLTLDELASATAGLSLRNVENILLQGSKAGVSRRLVKEAKDEIIASEQAEVAEMMDPLPGGFADLGGAEHLIAWAKVELIAPIRAGRWADTPKGVVFVGPPGTGKTRMAQALAKETGFNAVALRADKILQGIVGESEKRMAQFLGFVKALAPVLVFVDEIDESDFGRRGANSGNPVAANLFNQMLTFMSDEANRGRVVMVFATNRPDRLDPALLRSGRMDAVIPVLLPGEAQRADVAAVQARLQGVTLADGVAALVAARSERYSPADIAAVITKARKLAMREERAEITTEDATRALTYLRPNTPQVAAEYTALALEACNDVELLPPELLAQIDAANMPPSDAPASSGLIERDEGDSPEASPLRGRRRRWDDA